MPVRASSLDDRAGTNGSGSAPGGGACSLAAAASSRNSGQRFVHDGQVAEEQTGGRVGASG